MHFACIERKSSHSTRLWNFLPNMWRRSELCPINQIVIICMRLEFSLNFPIVELWLIVVVFFKWKHRFKGCGCPIFCYISQKTYKSINTTKDLNYYILVRCEGDSNNFSAPILINKPIIRTAFGMTTPQDTNVITHYTSNWENIHISSNTFFLLKSIDFIGCIGNPAQWPAIHINLRRSLSIHWSRQSDKYCNFCGWS